MADAMEKPVEEVCVEDVEALEKPVEDVLVAPGQDSMAIDEVVEEEGEHEKAYNPNPKKVKVCAGCLVCVGLCNMDPVTCWGCYQETVYVGCLNCKCAGCKVKPDKNTLFLCSEGLCACLMPKPVLCGGLQQCCCIDCRMGVPPNKKADVPVPMILAAGGLMCFPKVGCCKTLDSLGVAARYSEKSGGES